MTFGKEEREVLHLGQNHPTPLSRQGPDWLGVALLKKDQGIMKDARLNIS